MPLWLQRYSRRHRKQEVCRSDGEEVGAPRRPEVRDHELHTGMEDYVGGTKTTELHGKAKENAMVPGREGEGCVVDSIYSPVIGTEERR